MFHNIFSKKQTKIKSQKEKPKIIADIHEKDSMILAELAESKEVELIIHPLKIGDYLIGDIIIERKTVSDLISSMVSKRIIEQLKHMKQYPQQLLVIEGDLENTNFNPNAIKGFILSIITNYQIPVIFTKDYEDTSRHLIILAKQQLKPKTEISLHSRIPKTLKEQKQYILEAFPNIGPAKAKRLLKEFKTIKNTINAKEEDLEKILRGKTKDFKKIVQE